jgi:hypothetical protein
MQQETAHKIVGVERHDLLALRAAVPSRDVLELADASSGDMRLTDHAARSMI